MSNYVFGTSLTYRDYLQAKSFEDTFRSDISKNARLLIASNADLQKEHISITESLSATVSSGFEQLSYDLEALNEGITELRATFHWGFSEMLSVLGGVADSLSELVKTARTPAQTWAYEQFEISREAFRQRLYSEALEYVDHAINGYSSNTGYKLEYRFHYLLGTIRMGSFRNTSEDVVSLPKAESAFLNASRYARQDHTHEAARAFTAAGWVAYCQGRFPEAIQYTEEALALNPEQPEAHFQLAKTLMHIGNPDSGFRFLKKAIEFDRGYSLKASSDKDFLRYEVELPAFLGAICLQAERRANRALQGAEILAEEITSLPVDAFCPRDYDRVSSAQRKLQLASDARSVGTFYGYSDALSLCNEATVELQAAARGELARIEGRIRSIDRAGTGKLEGGVQTLGIVLSLVLGLIIAFRVADANQGQRRAWREYKEYKEAELRSMGYDPNRLSVEEARRLGYTAEDFPPSSSGRSALLAFLGYAFLGSLLAIAVGYIVGVGRQRSAMAPLLQEENRLLQIMSGLQEGRYLGQEVVLE